MELYLKRVAPRDTYTIGRLCVNDEHVCFCDTMEDKDRGLQQSMTPAEIASIKVPGETAIPAGRYRIDMDTYSSRFGGVQFYKDLCGGRLPRLVNVPGYSGVLIHAGNTAEDSAGCIIVGENEAVGKVLNSRATLTKLYNTMKAAHDAGEEIWITIYSYV